MGFQKEVTSINHVKDYLTSKDNVKVVLLSGKAGVGKDYIAKAIEATITKQNKNVLIRILPYALSLKEELITIGNIINKNSKAVAIKTIGAEFDLPNKVINKLFAYNISKMNLLNSHRDINYRSLLQWYGTDVRRNMDIDYWINKTLCLIYKLLQSKEFKKYVIIIPDARFVNEIECMKTTFINNCLAYRLIDSKKAILKREKARDTKSMTDKEHSHLSEISLDNYSKFTNVFDRSVLSTDIIVDTIIADLG
jgi:hypothetical protein